MASDNLAFATAIGVVANDSVSRVAHLRVRLARPAPSQGMAQACLPSDAARFASEEGWFATRARDVGESMEEACARSVREWRVVRGPMYNKVPAKEAFQVASGRRSVSALEASEGPVS